MRMGFASVFVISLAGCADRLAKDEGGAGDNSFDDLEGHSCEWDDDQRVWIRASWI